MNNFIAKCSDFNAKFQTLDNLKNTGAIDREEFKRRQQALLEEHGKWLFSQEHFINILKWSPLFLLIPFLYCRTLPSNNTSSGSSNVPTTTSQNSTPTIDLNSANTLQLERKNTEQENTDNFEGGTDNFDNSQQAFNQASGTQEFLKQFYEEVDQLTINSPMNAQYALRTMDSWQRQGGVKLGIQYTCEDMSNYNNDAVAIAQEAYKANDYEIPFEQLEVYHKAKFAAAQYISCNEDRN
jgi:hypothetical protein